MHVYSKGPRASIRTRLFLIYKQHLSKQHVVHVFVVERFDPIEDNFSHIHLLGT